MKFKSNIVFAKIAPTRPPQIWHRIKQIKLLKLISFFKYITNVTAGLKWAPEVDIKIQIRAVKAAPVAIECANKISSWFEEIFPPIIPEPTITITRNRI